MPCPEPVEAAREYRPHGGLLQRRQLGILQRQPLHPGFAEIHLHARIRAAAFEIDDHAFAELGVEYRLAAAPSGVAHSTICFDPNSPIPPCQGRVFLLP